MSPRVLHVVPSFYPATRYGGPIFTVLRLCQALGRAGVEVDVLTTDADGPEALDVPTGQFVEVEGVRVRYCRRDLPFDYASSTELMSFLRARVRDYDLVHVTSTFSHPSHVAGERARTAGVPFLVSPRGSLQPWSLAQKRWKKRPYWTLVERPRLANAAALHATSEMERTDLERLVPGVPVVVVPNGVDLPPAVQVPRDPRQVVFLGRLHPKKGLDILVTALARVARTFPDVHAVVAGPDDAAEWPRIERLLEGMSPRPRVRYVGEVKGEHKFRLLAQSAVFALPSHAENFGQAVVEAMSVGTPVLVSRNTPWSSVEARGAGAWLENTPEAFAEGLCRVLADPAGAAVMGTQASALAREFSWSSVGEAMAAAYASVLDRQPRPSP